MCCDDDTPLDLPPAVIEMLARYRRMHAEQGVGWGEETFPDMFRWARFSRLGPVFDEFAGSGDWAGAVRAAVGDDVPAGIVLVTVGGPGPLIARTGPPRPVVPGATVQIDVVLDSAAARDVVVIVQGTEVPVPAGGAGLRTVDATGPILVTCGLERCTIDAVEPAPAATLRLSSPHGARWSVTDATGGAWFADGAPAKWDAADRPFFHTDPGTTELTVPAGPLHVVAARGLEFEPGQFDVTPAAGETATVEYVPVRRFDPAADGWYGADLHVHLNYSGDHVLEPADAVRMQRGEGLALMHLAAGNLGGALVYDEELLAATAGTDLPAGDGIARTGLEFRNSLLGHVHGLGLTGVPELRYTGVEGTDHPWDWPPNSVACGRMRDLGAVTTYAHPVFAPGAGDDLFRPFRMVEARELVADAAIGVVDAVELASCFDDGGALVLYHHLLSCGLRLAATAGTDAFLSFARGPAPASNPPGWCRVYARLGDALLSTAAFTDAVRAGRTVVTNGPWLTLDVDGHGPGAVLDREAGERMRVRAHVVAADELVLHGPDGVIASGVGELEHEVTVDGGLWIAAAAHGRTDPHSGAPVFAHTTPVYVDVAGQRVARARSARWCLRQLDLLQQLADEQGQFDPQEHERQFGDLVAVLDRARAFYRDVEAAADSRNGPLAG